MGLDSNGTRLLLHAHARGVDFSTTATIGRQSLYTSPARLRQQFRKCGLPTDKLPDLKGPFADDFFKCLGAETLHSFDASNYESPDHVHDFNETIDTRHHQAYRTVFDGGSLEHVFNFPTAIRNCMEMVAEGGHFVAINPANNFFGHGFYQFSPELYFRIFSAANGFEVQQMIVYEESYAARFYEVLDPEAVQRRVALVNHRPTYLFIIAKRKELVPVFANPPQQSDYSATWSTAAREGSTGAPADDRPAQRSALREKVSAWLSRRKSRRIQSLDNREFFHPLDL